MDVGTTQFIAPKRRGRRWPVVVSVLAVAVLGVGASVLLYRFDNPRSVRADASPSPVIVPLAVIGTSPANGASNVPAGTPITVSLSTGLAPTSPMPTFTPPVPGTWSALSPTELQFVADGPLVPGSAETLTVPGGTGGLVGTIGQRLPASTTVSFSVALGSTLRLQQLLAQLGYLPVSFTPATEPTSPQDEADPQEGTFSWRWTTLPTALTTQWIPGTFGVITRGAVMRFETVSGLTTTGAATPQVWADLLQDAASGTADPDPYDYVLVSKTLPETVFVYSNGAVAYTTPANTGVPGAPTATGTFPVYARFQVTTMVGTNPTGSHYVDPGIPWVSYFNGGDALHGFIRGGYGYPQSDGCVEMPPANAEVVWPLTPLGTLVTVEE